jgi:hypothetical protein
VLAALAGFVDELRALGMAVSLSEHLDAAEALTHVPLDDRDAFKAALATTLVKQAGHRSAFDTVFDVWFSLGLAEAVGDGGPDDEADAGSGNSDAGGDDLARRLDEALASGDPAALAELARTAVTRHGGPIVVWGPAASSCTRRCASSISTAPWPAWPGHPSGRTTVTTSIPWPLAWPVKRGASGPPG